MPSHLMAGSTRRSNSGKGDKTKLNEKEAFLFIRPLHKVSLSLSLRRLNEDVEGELLQNISKPNEACMSAVQLQLYKQMKKCETVAGSKDFKGYVRPFHSTGTRPLTHMQKIWWHEGPEQ